jgi:p-cumate 2,3-dioxygenase beta subunit
MTDTSEPRRPGGSRTGDALFTVGEVEQFLVHEAALLDEWRLDEWLALFAEDGKYLVPSLDAPDSDHRTALFLIADDRRNLASRIRQLLGGMTWAENPRSRTRRLVTNFRILDGDAGSVTATANFAVWRFQHEATDVYVGRYLNILIRGPSGPLFRERRVILDLETLRPHGKLSFIL